MAIMEINIIPIGTASPSLGEHLIRALKILKMSGMKYELTSMTTIVEGELEELFQVAKKMHSATFSHGIKRVVTTVKIDEREDKVSSMEEKVKRVKEKL